jgi:hypothetical protein
MHSNLLRGWRFIRGCWLTRTTWLIKELRVWLSGVQSADMLVCKAAFKGALLRG